jgi:hypothetical protein
MNQTKIIFETLKDYFVIQNKLKRIQKSFITMNAIKL